MTDAPSRNTSLGRVRSIWQTSQGRSGFQASCDLPFVPYSPARGRKKTATNIRQSLRGFIHVHDHLHVQHFLIAEKGINVPQHQRE